MTICVCFGTPARAEEPKEILTRANAHFDLGKFAQAAGEYEKLYEVHPDPVLFYNIAQSYRLAGDNDKALFFYKRFRTKLPDHPNSAEVMRRISDLEKLQEQQRLARLPPNEPTPLRTTVPGDQGGRPPEPATKAEPTKAEPTKAEPEPTPSTGKDEPSASTPIFKKGWFWGLIAAVVLVGAGVGIGAAVASGGGPTFMPNFGEAGPGKTGALVRF